MVSLAVIVYTFQVVFWFDWVVLCGKSIKWRASKLKYLIPFFFVIEIINETK